MNNITIAGHVGRDAQLRNTQSDQVASFSLAVSEGKDKTTWFDCSIWGDRASKLSQYITKGTSLAVSGRVSARVHEGKAYLQVSVSQVTFLGGRQQASEPQRQQSQPSDHGGLDDGIPF